MSAAKLDSKPPRTLSRWVPSPTPKNLITILITIILLIGEWRYGAVGGYGKFALTLGVCVATELVLSLFLLGRVPVFQSAYITGVSLSMLVRPQSGILWPFVAGAALSIASKYVLRYRGRHLFNPSNLGLAALLLLAPSQVALLSHEFGNDLLANTVIWSVGFLVAARARILHVSITYVACFGLLAAGRGLVTGTPMLAEFAPLTGPMYQLLVFFMLTDPRTTVSSRRGRMVTVALIALVEAAIRLGNDFDASWAAPLAPAPPIIALAIVGPIALAIDLARKANHNPSTGTVRPALARVN